MERASGVLMHISSLNGGYSIGGFSKSAEKFIDLLSDCGFSYWQTLPFCVADEYNSPYQSPSAFAGNQYFIDLEKLYKLKLITGIELELAREDTPYACEYERLRKERMKLLYSASKRVDEKLRKEIEKFTESNCEIFEFCKFMAIKAKNNGTPWNEWKTYEYNTDELFMWQFTQYFFHIQWQELKAYANKKGISIIGDVPIYVSYDSCDVYNHKEQFDLDVCGNMNNVAGCPPDYFAEDGQLWGNPVYNWDNMKKDGYAWWKKRISHMFTLFDGVRLDHFRGFEAYWSVPSSAETAKEGKWKKGPGREFIKMLKDVAGTRLIIAEDLGDITDGVKKLLKYSGFPGMRVLQFGFTGENNSTHMPHNYERNIIAYTGTHDNNTLLGYVWDCDEERRKDLLEYCGHIGDDWDSVEAYDAIIRTLMSSVADIVIFPIQDLLYYGSDTRMNIPGDAKGNWAFRVTSEALENIDKAKLLRFNKLYCRYNEENKAENNAVC